MRIYNLGRVCGPSLRIRYDLFFFFFFFFWGGGGGGGGGVNINVLFFYIAKISFVSISWNITGDPLDNLTELHTS